MPDKALFTVGVFAGILNGAAGKLLLRQRDEEGSILPGRSFRGNWELPGGGVMDNEKISYGHLSRELERELKEELGIEIFISSTPAFYPAPFKGPKGCDLALVTPIILGSPISPRGGAIWVSPEELDRLARKFIAPNKQTGISGEGLLSGHGKRMHCMALAALSHSPNSQYAVEAASMLAEIQKSW